LASVHDAQLLTLPINFNVALLRSSIHQRVLGLEE